MSVTRRLLTTLAVGATSMAAVLIPSAGAHAATGTYSLVVLPDQGESGIYNFVNSATQSIDITIYELRDTTLVNDLIAKQQAGVTVRVIMDGQHTSIDGPAYDALQAAGVGVTWSSPSFTYTHQKTITVDGAESYISTGNFDTTYYATSRDYGIFDTDSADVSAIEDVFNADYNQTSITPSDGDNLVWSPTDSQSQLLNLINGAQTSLDIEQEEFGDSTLVNAIVAAEQRGVTVRVVAENENNSYTSKLNQVTAAGGQVTTYTSSTGYYIHAKAIVADYGTATAKAFAGSENFSSNSLNNNRELGIILSDSGVVSGLESAFTADFNQTAGV
jgi:phosphatidylserine/phosphatidylglycerophosphate/cardiolipin synthase-like enzyme